MSSQRAIPSLLMRGGASKGPFFKESRLDEDDLGHSAFLSI